MGEKSLEIQTTPQGSSQDLPWNLDAENAYANWRSDKLQKAIDCRNDGFVAISDLANPGATEKVELIRRCRETNMALYQTDPAQRDQNRLRDDLRAFAGIMGLQIAENHRSAAPDGVVALTVTDAPAQRGYIPYSRKPMNWHTDGYYNPPAQAIRAMVLHCAIPAMDGGQNQLLDPEIAYIRLRDINPGFITALMHPAAMTIPQNIEPDGRIRAASVGPVFSIDAAGNLTMRYTARTRSIVWRDDDTTHQAVAALQSLLTSGDPMMRQLQFKPGQGVLCNNVLHNRTGFDPDATPTSARLVYRIRFHNRIMGS